MASIPHLDKVLHFALMGLLAWVANIALGHHRLRLGSLRVLTGSLVILLIVAAEEASQAWFPARSCDWRDLVADLLGIVCASLLSPRSGASLSSCAGSPKSC
jgi:VanZ family protein